MVSRTPGTDSSTPSSSTAAWCTFRPVRVSSGTTSPRRFGSAEAATHSSSAARNGRPVNQLTISSTTASVRIGPFGSASSSRCMSATRTSVTCSTAAVISASRVGKWCCAAPRETPARSATTVTVLPVQPSWTRHSTAASRSR